MSRQGEGVQSQIKKLRSYLENQAENAKSGKGVEFMQGVLDVLENINLRVQEQERANDYNDAFVDPNEGTHRIT